MITFEGVTEELANHYPFLSNASFTLMANNKTVIYCQDGASRIALLNLIAGVTRKPKQGHIYRTASFSFPIGFFGGIAPDLSLRENAVLMARMYGLQPRDVIDFIASFPIVDDEMDVSFLKLTPVARLLAGYLLPYSIPFDCYLLDRSLARGSPATKEIASKLFDLRCRESGAILTTGNWRIGEDFNVGAIMHAGELVVYENVADAARAFRALPMASQAISQQEDLFAVEDEDEGS